MLPNVYPLQIKIDSLTDILIVWSIDWLIYTWIFQSHGLSWWRFFMLSHSETSWVNEIGIILICEVSILAHSWWPFHSLQGLSDTEEFVVCKALNALTCLAELGLLQKPTLQELVSEIVPFLCHPVSLCCRHCSLILHNNFGSFARDHWHSCVIMLSVLRGLIQEQ